MPEVMTMLFKRAEPPAFGLLETVVTVDDERAARKSRQLLYATGIRATVVPADASSVASDSATGWTVMVFEEEWNEARAMLHRWRASVE